MIRIAQDSDSTAIAYVHIQSWKTTYTGMVRQSILDNLTLERRQQLWQKVLADPLSLVLVFLIEDQVVGFIDGYFMPDQSYAEIRAIYLLQSYQQQGIGQALLDVMMKKFRQKNYRTVCVSVLDQNPAIAFYLKQGAKIVDQKDASAYGDNLKELVYAWSI